MPKWAETMLFVYETRNGTPLKEVRQAVQSGRCEFIQEYDENEYLPPAKGEPVIESVRFVAGEKLEDILSAYKK